MGSSNSKQFYKPNIYNESSKTCNKITEKIELNKQNKEENIIQMEQDAKGKAINDAFHSMGTHYFDLR